MNISTPSVKWRNGGILDDYELLSRMKCNTQGINLTLSNSVGNDQVDVIVAANTSSATDAVRGSAVNENQHNSCLRSELTNMHGERRGIQVIQHNTNQISTREKPDISPTIVDVNAWEINPTVATIASRLHKLLNLIEKLTETQARCDR